MYRKYLSKLHEWLGSAQRKPLVIRGARQVGKTWLVRQLAKESGKQLLELNFEKNPALADLFISNDVKKIIRNLEFTFGEQISITNSLLFLDEIQIAPQMLGKLRWFFEDVPELAVVAAGSLLDFALEKHTFSMPVGRISYMYLQPMNFEEFLLATERKLQCEYLHEWQLDQKIPPSMHDLLCGAVQEYVLVGGMPEAVNNWCETKSFLSISQTQNDLLATYRDDFNKYNTRINKERLEEVLQTIPYTLGNKFKYSQVNNAVQSSVVKHALDLLCTARLVHKIYSTSVDGLPLKANINHKFFKVIFLDIGLVSALLKATSFSLNNFGGVAEQLVGQELLSSQLYFQEPELFYWNREEKNSSAEVDYIIQHAEKIIPLEVKSGSTGTLRSLHLLMQMRQLDFAVRINGDLPSLVHTEKFRLLSLPFYLLGQLDRLIATVS